MRKQIFHQTGVALAILVCLSGCRQTGATLSRDIHTSRLDGRESEITAIISHMTPEEKVAMLHGKHMFTSAGVASQGIADMSYADGPFGIREEMEPHSWNSLHLDTDSATFFPTGSALAATWDEDLAYLYGTGMAAEARRRGKDMILGPAINIQRIPTGGRTYEYLSEDPFLNARLAVGYTKGVQDHGVAVCLKHFALNNQETNRGSVNVIVSNRALREIYLPPFEAAVVEGDAFGIMSAYNKVNGTWCGENELLLNQILRKDWGFKGMVISDWGGTHSPVRSLEAGLNVEMPDSTYHGRVLLDSLATGQLSEAVLNERVREILRVRKAIAPVPAAEANRTRAGQADGAAIAYQVAAKSIVLLKNEGGLLPVNRDTISSIAVIGDNATRTMASGGVGAGVKAVYEITPLEGIKALAGDLTVTYARGYAQQQGRRLGRWDGINFVDDSAAQAEQARQLQDEAVEAARNADVVFFIGGNNRQWETEGSDRQSMQLPYGQDSVLTAIAAVNPNVVFVVVAGAPVDLNAADACAPAIVQSWFNGTEGGRALAEVLFGVISPSGRLPFSYPQKLEDSPAYAMGNFPQTDAPVSEDVFVKLTGRRDDAASDRASGRSTAVYSEDMLVGYRWFETKHLPVRYAFGYGLTYSTFEYKDISASISGTGHNARVEVTFQLTNTGDRAADEVVQLYVHRIDAIIAWPFKELKAFRRMALNPGETVTVKLQVPVDQLAFWDESIHNWAVESGAVELLVGASSSDIRLRSVISI